MQLRIGLVVLHTSPLAAAGSGDAGGMNVVVRAQAKALAADGHEVTIYTRRSDASAVDLDDVDGLPIKVRFLPAGPPTPLAKSAIDQHIPEFAEALDALLAEAAADDRLPHVLHSHHWMSGIAALDLARRYAIPHLQSFHSIAATGLDGPLGHGEPPESPARVPGEARCARESDLIVAISKAEARTAVERLGADPERIVIVPPGVRHDTFYPADEEPVGGPIVAAARLQPLKGLDLAIETLAHVDEQVRPKLVVAGASSADFADYEADLQRLVDEHGLRDHVEFVGAKSRSGLADLLRSARLTLVPSHSETYGLIALEAAACGAPVVASAAGGLVEAVVDGETGVTLETRDPREWGRVVEDLLRDPDRLHAMREAAIAHARARRWEDSARLLAAHYFAALSPDVWLPTGDGPVVFLHAHPDDESIQTGALIRHLTAGGVRVDLITATRGERGQVVPGPLSHLEGTPALMEHRLGELARATAHLGIERQHFLGEPPAREPGEKPRIYHDSGMRWISEHIAGPDEDAPDDALTLADPAEAAHDVAAYLREVGARALFSYDAYGTYGHPDHVRCHELAVAASEATGVPLFEVVSPEVNQEAAGRSAESAPSIALALERHAPAAVAALREHASQLTVDGEDIVHSGGQREALDWTSSLRRVR